MEIIMKLAVLSDIHGNLEAFKQVLKDIDQSPVDAVICLGDNIGYGPDPEPVVQLIRERNIASVMGNHELAVADRDYLNWFNPLARKSLEKTIDMLSPPSINFLAGLPTSQVLYDCRFVHGFPPDSATTYLFQVSDRRLGPVFEQMKEKICFAGHTHELELIEYDGQNVTRSALAKGMTCLDKHRKYILNIGSVGQPRDGDNRAKYVIWNALAYCVEVRFIRYDAASVADKIIAAGLPKAHASRLY